MPEAESERFEALYRAYGRDIVAYCGWRAGSPSDAQDAVAEVFLTAWRRLPDIPDGDAARVWLYATARRVIATHWRTQRRRAGLQQRLESTADRGPVGAGPDVGEHALVHDALRRLDDGDREVLLLAEWEDLAPAEIATVLDCLPVTARGRLHRARRRFRAAYQRLAGGAPDRNVLHVQRGSR